MSSRFNMLNEKELVVLPNEVQYGLIYETIIGSESYGLAKEGSSDIDVAAVCIPQKEDVFPHLKSEILGFGKQTKQFTTWQKHHILDKDSGKEYDLTAYGLVKFFSLCYDNNPNLLDVLYSPDNCVVYATPISDLMRNNRDLFLSKQAYKTCVAYSYSQLKKLRTKVPLIESKRYESYVKLSYDSKYAMHLFRLILQAEQILSEHTLDLQKNKEQLKSVRAGELALDQIEGFFFRKEKQLEELYVKSTLQHKPDEDKIKALLLECLEMHYGSLEKAVYIAPDLENDLKMISKIVNKYNY